MSDQHDHLDSYDWQTAPAYLMTRRQLRAAGLRPGGAEPVAVMVRQRRGRRLVAHLYDSRTAPPKRRASPAQLVAIAKAVRAHQLAAAVRRGLTEEQLTTAADPGTAWATTVATEKGNTMSETQRTHQTPESVALDEARFLAERLAHAEKDAQTPGLFVGHSDAAPHRAVGPAEGVAWLVTEARSKLHSHLVESRHLLGQQPEWAEHYAEIDDTSVVATKVKPVGHGQRTAHLHAVVAVNQARHHRADRDRERDIAVGEGPQTAREFTDLVVERQAAAEARLAEPIRWANRDQVASTLAEALSWRSESPVAAEMATKLIGAYAVDWGVVIDADKGTVRIDPKHDAAEQQLFDELSVVLDRESAVIDIVSASSLDSQVKGPVMEAIGRWRGELDAADPAAHIADAGARREQLRAELAEIAMPADARAYLDLTVDYLRGDVTAVDLLATPVSVDPGEEARGRMSGLLDLYAGGSVPPQHMADEIAVLTPADQQLVREIGRAIRDGKNPDIGVWPDYLDRDQFAEDLTAYLHDAADQRAEADYIVDKNHYSPHEIGISDDIGERIERMATNRESLRVAVEQSRGLSSTERHQLTALLADIEVGRVLTREQLPELLFLDERTKSEVDLRREPKVIDAALADLPSEVDKRVAAATDLSPDNPVAQVITTAATNLHTTVREVAAGQGARTIEQSRELFTAQRSALGKALSRAGVDRDTMGEIRTLVDTNAKAAAQTRTTLAERRAQWPARVDKIVVDRDQAAAQAAAMAKGGQGRACRTRADRAAAQASEPAPAPAPSTVVTAGRGMRR